MDYDIIVVGGGPAGASAAYFNATKGKRVLLIEKAEFPRDKVCGDGVTGKALQVLHEMGLSNEVANIKEISCNGPISRYVMGQNEQPKQNRNHYSSAIREYWEGVSDNQGQIEIHFIDGILPGYFWIFPISENRFNVGLGMLLSDMDKQSVKLKEMLDWVVNSSFLSERFANAKPIENTRRGWMLPMGSPRGLELNPRKNFVEGCILIGDSASLIDPFTGEGIGNALVSGKLTTKYPLIDNETGIQYQKELWGMIGDELTNSYRLQKLLKKRRLMDWFFKKASRKPALQEILTDMLHNKESQTVFKSKWFWFKALLF